jgi:Na+/melibiose symporter-like transporter
MVLFRTDMEGFVMSTTTRFFAWILASAFFFVLMFICVFSDPHGENPFFVLYAYISAVLGSVSFILARVK